MKGRTIALLTWLAAKAVFAGNSVEVSGNQDSHTIDTKTDGSIGRFGYAGRHQAATNNGETEHFSLVDATYPIGYGVDAVVEAQYTDKPVARAGLQHLGEWKTVLGTFGQYTLLTSQMDGSLELLTDTSLSGIPHCPVDARLETITNPNMRTRKLRIGREFRGVEMGYGRDSVWLKGEDEDFKDLQHVVYGSKSF
ncbi:MAG: hypothetical protein ABH879_09055 [archaeon]